MKNIELIGCLLAAAYCLYCFASSIAEWSTGANNELSIVAYLVIFSLITTYAYWRDL